MKHILRPNWVTILPTLLAAFAVTAITMYDDVSLLVGRAVKVSVRSVEDAGYITGSTASVVSGPGFFMLVMATITVASWFLYRIFFLRRPKDVRRVVWYASLAMQATAQTGAVIYLYWSGHFRPFQRWAEDFLYGYQGNAFADGLAQSGVYNLVLPAMAGWFTLNLLLAVFGVVWRHPLDTQSV